MAIYHLSIKIVKRSQGKSAVAAAAYRAGEKITNDYDGMTHDYTRKGGVVHSEILLPTHAPTEFFDRSTLWNAVEQIEKHRRAQLAREIEIALPNELSRLEQIKLVQDYCQQTFVDSGMCADFAIHDPKGAQENVHAHILLSMRPLNEDGSWGDKQKKEYLLDERGEKIYDAKKKQYKCTTVSSTDWNEQTKAEEWRAAWAAFANRALVENSIPEKLDHRSYERQGIDQIPTIHLGVAATQMERRGILTEKGNLNRIIREDNRLIRELKAKIRQLTAWLKELQALATEHESQPPALADLLLRHHAGAPDSKKLRAVAYLQSNQIDTYEQLKQHIVEMHVAANALIDTLKQSERQMKALRDLLDASTVYLKTKPLHDAYRQRKSEVQRQAFYAAHTPDLLRFDAAKKKLDALLPDRKLHTKKWEAEYDRLCSARDADYARLKTARDRLAQVEEVRKLVEQVRWLPDQQRSREQEL